MMERTIKMTHNASFIFANSSSVSASMTEEVRISDDEISEYDLLGQESEKLRELIEERSFELRRSLALQIDNCTSIMFGNAVINSKLLQALVLETVTG
jgi:hypothetical protein